MLGNQLGLHTKKNMLQMPNKRRAQLWNSVVPEDGCCRCRTCSNTQCKPKQRGFACLCHNGKSNINEAVQSQLNVATH